MVVAVPRSLRHLTRTPQIIKKAGNTFQEAKKNATRLELEIRQSFERDTPLQDARASMGDLSKLTDDEEQLVREVFISDPQATDADRKAIHSALLGRDTWMEWVEKRIRQEDPAGSTVTCWNSYLRQLSKWFGNECLQDMTKKDAVRYKETLLERMTPSSCRKVISCHKGFWTWAKTHDQLTENIWDGLTRKLDSTKKKPLPPEPVITVATEKAIEKEDFRYVIMRFTGCRSNEANGLRHCDIDLENRTISFLEWTSKTQERRLKGRDKDERVIPLSTALYDALKSIQLDGSEDPIWSSAYKEKSRTWGAHWASDFKGKYGFVSHDLRRLAVTKLTLAGVSPFIIHSITKQKVPGMSEVVATYTRPTVDQLREALELL